ncbi:Uncharacterized conserved protein, contains PQ loop repeat [Micromonospora pattaloongensis]|uniref:Uncharacterized conserved protein, contains PQ loop repeat n=1 Tax=Micromonospora pattaloongensis TaxID=405436 RepID=A0A1H3QY61_9ACTN|nr:hypothetical protein [Micromonospora pattaloongensis]SDZ17649.1 Uncharacterized conserved protein, contains PQ loop repeat [Micromonospora pattaloongensis]
MSALTLLGITGNVLSTVAIFPHLAQAIRERRPSGSAFGWSLGALCGLLWLTYGILTQNLIVGAPGWITVPVGAALGFWCWKSERGPVMALVAPSLAPAPAPAVAPATPAVVAATPDQAGIPRQSAAATLTMPKLTPSCTPPRQQLRRAPAVRARAAAGRRQY